MISICFKAPHIRIMYLITPVTFFNNNTYYFMKRYWISMTADSGISKTCIVFTRNYNWVALHLLSSKSSHYIAVRMSSPGLSQLQLRVRLLPSGQQYVREAGPVSSCQGLHPKLHLLHGCVCSQLLYQLSGSHARLHGHHTVCIWK